MAHSLSPATCSISTCDMSLSKKGEEKKEVQEHQLLEPKFHISMQNPNFEDFVWRFQTFKLLQLEFLKEPNNILDTSSLKILEPNNDFLPEPPNRTIPWTVPALAQAATLHAHQATVWNPFVGLVVNIFFSMHTWLAKKYTRSKTHVFSSTQKIYELHVPTGVAIMASLKGTKKSAFRCKRWWLYTKHEKSKIPKETEVEIIPTKPKRYPNRGILMGLFSWLVHLPIHITWKRSCFHNQLFTAASPTPVFWFWYLFNMCCSQKRETSI